MKYLPEDRSAWVRLALLPFKTLVVLAPFWRFAWVFGPVARWSRYSDVPLSYLVTDVLILCVVVLIGGALVQSLRCKRGDTWKTLVYVALGLLFGPFWGFVEVLWGIPSGTSASMVLADAIDIAITSYAGFAYRRTKLPGMIVLAVANGILVISRAVMRFPDVRHSPNAALIDLMSLIVPLCQIGSFIGVALLIRFILNGAERKQTPSQPE